MLAADAASPGRRERNKQDKLERIKQAARRLFHAQGFEATTTQAVAEAAGIGAGTLFSYARVKEDLLLMVLVDDLVEVMTRARRSVPVRSGLLPRLRHFYGALLRYHAGAVPLSRHFVRETFAVRTAERRADLQRLMQAVLEPTTLWILEERSQGRLRSDVDASRAAWGFWAFYYGIVSGMLNEIHSLSQARHELQRSFECLMRGLSA